MNLTDGDLNNYQWGGTCALQVRLGEANGRFCLYVSSLSRF